VLGGAAESFADALLARAGQRGGGREVEWLAVVAQAAGDLAVLEEPRSWSERV